jgi:gluconolactonase
MEHTMPEHANPFASGFKFPEGPAFDRHGNLYVVNVRANHVNKVTVGGQVSVFSQWEGAKPNGSCFDHDGRLLVCDSGNKQIVRLDAAGQVQVLSREPAPGQRYLGPNDLCIDHNSRIYFTDPGDFRKPTGAIYRLDPDGRVTQLDQPLQFCNGIALDRQQKWLYVAQTPLKRIDRYELAEDGSVGPRQPFAQLEEAGTGPDGMRFDRDGFLYYAHFGLGKVVRLSPDGQKVAEFDAGGKNPTNLAFGPLPDAKNPADRSQWRCLYITEAEKDQVNRQIVEVPGMELG